MCFIKLHCRVAFPQPFHGHGWDSALACPFETPCLWWRCSLNISIPSTISSQPSCIVQVICGFSLAVSAFLEYGCCAVRRVRERATRCAGLAWSELRSCVPSDILQGTVLKLDEVGIAWIKWQGFESALESCANCRTWLETSSWGVCDVSMGLLDSEGASASAPRYLRASSHSVAVRIVTMSWGSSPLSLNFSESGFAGRLMGEAIGIMNDMLARGTNEEAVISSSPDNTIVRKHSWPTIGLKYVLKYVLCHLERGYFSSKPL